MYGIGLSLFYQLDVGADAHVFADKEATCFKGGVPGEAKVGTVDFAGDGKARFLIAPRIFGGTGEVHVKGDWFGNAFDGEVASQFAACRIVAVGFEAEARVVFSIEEVGGTKVSVALFVGGIDAAGLSGEVHFGVAKVGRVGIDLCGDLIETAGHGSNHKVFHLKEDFAVGGVEDPFRCCHKCYYLNSSL